MGKPRLVSKLHHDRLVLHRLQEHDQQREFMQGVSAGLSQSPKTLSPMFFYDEQGSKLFEQITELEEYYPTRTEAALLESHAGEVIEAAREGEDICLVELGSGSSTKTRLLLNEIAERQSGLTYVPIDISPTIVTEFGERLLDDYPGLNIRGLICDYYRAMEELGSHPDERRLFLFLGSSLGNFTLEEASDLLQAIRAAMNSGDMLLMGLDMVKDERVLHDAYNDRKGVTAAFNLNLLGRINRELGGDFDLSQFRHKAFYNREQRRIEMHVESLCAQSVTIEVLGQSFSFAAGETIHTENSYKFDSASLQRVLHGTEFDMVRQWCDANEWYTLNLIVPT